MSAAESANALSKIELAAAVAQRVEIETVRLLDASFSQSAHVAMTRQPEIRLHVRTTPSVEPTNNRIVIVASFGILGTYPEQSDPVLRIEAVYELSYSASALEGLEPIHIQAFGDLNGRYNGWPYWREFVQSAFARMGLPQLTMPVYRPSASDYQKPALPEPPKKVAARLGEPPRAIPATAVRKKKASKKTPK